MASIMPLALVIVVRLRYRLLYACSASDLHSSIRLNANSAVTLLMLLVVPSALIFISPTPLAPTALSIDLQSANALIFTS